MVILVENLWSLLQFSRSHQATCGASTKLVITPSSEVKKMPHLLHENINF
jgi:hypothetical protein